MKLDRICNLLGIAGAMLSEVHPDGLVTCAGTGSSPRHLAPLEDLALAQDGPLVIADACLASVRFYAGIQMSATDQHPQLLLSLYDSKPRSVAMANTIAAMAGECLASAEVVRQRAQIAEQQRQLTDFIALERQRRDLFDRASETAKIGIWQYDLTTSTLSWTHGVYDIFEIPRDTPITRQMSLACYTEESRIAMETARSRAIATCTDFSITVELVTAKGNRRWMRLTGAVEARDGVAHRIFGMKQDITEEKLLADQTRYLAEYDTLTGLANRGVFQSHLSALDQPDSPGAGSLLLVDLDGFKQVNDTNGHAVGDDCLKEIALRLTQVCPSSSLVARIGGDEFAVLLPASSTPSNAEALAQAIVTTCRHPVQFGEKILRLGASVGIAHYYGDSAESFFHQADTALYAAKASGRSTSRVFGVSPTALAS